MPRNVGRPDSGSRRRHRHVGKTGEIKDFVITEEGGIAKGIRRIVALTAEDAREASARASVAEQQFDEISRMGGATREKALKTFDSVSQMSVSVLIALLTPDELAGLWQARHSCRPQGISEGQDRQAAQARSRRGARRREGRSPGGTLALSAASYVGLSIVTQAGDAVAAHFTEHPDDVAFVACLQEQLSGKVRGARFASALQHD